MNNGLKLLLITSAIFITGCAPKNIIKVPVYQELIVNDPQATEVPTLNSPKFTIMSAEEMRQLASQPSNADNLYAVIPVELLSQLLDDQLAQYEYAKKETMRAEFYKNTISSFNQRMRELNQKAQDNP